MGLPPGPRYLLHLIPHLALPPLLVLTFLHILSINLATPPPLYLRILTFALSWPLSFVVLVQWRSWTNRSNAAAIGAVMPEEVKHTLPGSLDLLMKMFENDRKLYLGESPLPVYGWCAVDVRAATARKLGMMMVHEGRKLKWDADCRF